MGRSLEFWKGVLSPEAYEQLEQKYNAKAAAKSTDNRISSTTTKLERAIVNASNETQKDPRFDSAVAIHVHCRRHRLADHENLCAKYLIDAIRYRGILQDDSPKWVKEVTYSQEKCKVEETVLTIRAI